MTCYHPMTAYQPAAGGKAYFSHEKTNPSDRKIQFPCGQCSGCRLERSRQWAIRCVHESTLYDDNIFITLTYDEEHLPYPPSLNKKHYQDFMKRLRRKYDKTKIRFYHCGEYGDQLQRPHYHAILFNLDFHDKELIKQIQGINLYHSDTLDSIWGKGYCTIGDVTFESAAYVARYVMKKQKISEKSPEHIQNHYQQCDPSTGEIFDVEPEYTTMSRRPGIAAKWIEKYTKDVYPSDEITHQGRTLRVPAYYDKIYDQTAHSRLREIKEQRLERARLKHADNTPERLAVKEKVALAKLNLFKTRDYEK